jgi:hypothetical protein
MAKDLPYFKFYISEWTDGDITLESLSTQGLFVNVCCYYWSKETDVKIDQLFKRFGKNPIESLIKKEIIKLESDKVSINFLDEQFKTRTKKARTNAKNGKNGGRPKTQTKPTGLFLGTQNKPNAKPLRREEKRREENILKALCLVFGKQFKQPDERLPGEVSFYREIELQYDLIAEVLKDSNTMLLQSLAYIKHCDNTGRKRIGTVHKLAETILGADWLVLNGDVNPKEDPYSEARHNRTLWTKQAWEDQYADKIAFDKEFQKSFGYAKL